MPRLLAEFIHVSDLHYGPAPEPLTAESRIARIFNKLIHVIRPVHPLFGHNRAALVSLERFIRKERLQGKRQNYPVQLIVTGDLTSFGAPAQFQEITQYLARHVPPAGYPIGLNQGNWQSYTIPGNHDHWPGAPTIVGAPAAAFQTTFEPLPIVDPGKDPIFPLGTGLPVVRFLRIDTDAGVDPDSMHRFLALGRFERHLSQLSDRLARSPRGEEFRVLLLHHSITHRADSLYIVEESRDALNRFILDHGIALLLCGHTHKAGLQLHDASLTKQVLEVRCGTTTQIGREDYTSISQELGDPPVDSRIWRRSLLVHRLYESAGRIDWKVQVYVEKLEEPASFEPAGRLPSLQAVQQSVAVWPLQP
jgi:3',5'-cyclic AMP phosphodiesterase CpdA